MCARHIIGDNAYICDCEDLNSKCMMKQLTILVYRLGNIQMNYPA